MCGFVGGTDSSLDFGVALDSIFHRGPDDGRLHVGEQVTVGFRRLSIIDLHQNAGQPMFAPDGDSWVVFNGEIYGFSNIRSDLESCGYVFRTLSDTEVVLRAYLEWGDNFIDHLEGMFAIVIWDASKRKLKLFRDRPGIKPLYYFYDGKTFAFASELKALQCALHAEDLQTDQTALYDFMAYRYIPAPKTPYKNCFKLLPAHRLVFDLARNRLDGPNPYWTLPVAIDPRPVPVDVAAEEARSLIQDSVQDQMVADVPVGFFLSGGVDSSVVVAEAARSGEHVSTFSIGFDIAARSETIYAQEIANLFQTNHRERIMSLSDAKTLLPRMKSWFDEPFAGESALPTYLVSEVAREQVTVVLTGDGGDEVFGGYRTYPRFERYNSYPSWSSSMEKLTHLLRRPFGRYGSMTRVTTLLELALSNGPELWGKIMSGMPDAERRSYRNCFEIPADYDDWWAYRTHWRDDLPPRTRLQIVDFHTYMPDHVLAKVDRTSMAVSLEARVPLLHRRIVEFAFSLPESIRYHGGASKGLLRHAYRGVLPDHILDRRKRGFGVPSRYLKSMLITEYMEEYVLREFGVNLGR